MKISDLREGNKRINIVVKVGEKSDARDVTSKTSGQKFRIADATVMDESGSMRLTLWNEQIGQINVGDSLDIKGAYVTAYKGNLQLNVGRFGSMTKALKN